MATTDIFTTSEDGYGVASIVWKTGANLEMGVESSAQNDGPYEYHAFLFFDWSAEAHPELVGATITGLELHLYLNAAGGELAGNEIHAFVTDGGDMALTAADYGVACDVGEDMGTLVIPGTTGAKVMTLDTGSSQGYAQMELDIVWTVEGVTTSSFLQIASSENATESRRPHIQVTYTPAAGADTPQRTMVGCGC